MAQKAIPSYYIAITVVRNGNRFLAVHERKHGGGWFFPAGRVEVGETITDAARRETLEETGVPVELDGILRIEHTPWPDYTRVRVFFLAHAERDVPPKSTPDEESQGAAWFTVDELERLDLRDQEVLMAFRYVESGASVYPLSLLTQEGTRWVR